MPASRQSQRLTELYRRRLVETAARAQARAEEFWPRIEGLDESDWPERAAAIVTRAQTEAVRLSAGYLTAYVGSERGHRERLTPIAAAPYVGLSRDGRPLTEALRSPIIGVLGALKAGKSSSEALNLGLVRAKRMVSFEAVQTGRDALLAAIEEDKRTDSHERAVSGTCAACMALSGTSGPQFEVHPGCFPAGTEVEGPRALAATKRWFDGELVDVRYGPSDVLSCTPNHPVLTPQGWVAAGLLDEGSSVVRGLRGQRSAGVVNPDDQGHPVRIEQVSEALRSASGVTTMTVPVAPEDFHGDGTRGDVQVEWADRLPQNEIVNPTVGEHSGEVALCLGCVSLLALAGLGSLDSLLGTGFATAAGFVGSLSLGTAGLSAQPRVLDQLSGRRAADGDARLDEPLSDGGATDSEPDRDGLLRFASLVGRDDFGCVQVQSVVRRAFSGHVFNLQTREGWYTANRTVVHNCECIPVPKVAGVSDRFPLPSGAALFTALTRPEQEKAIGPEAAALVRDGGADLRDFVAHSTTDSDQPSWITQKPVDQVT